MQKSSTKYTHISRKTSLLAGTPFDVSMGAQYVSPACEGFECQGVLSYALPSTITPAVEIWTPQNLYFKIVTSWHFGICLLPWLGRAADSQQASARDQGNCCFLTRLQLLEFCMRSNCSTRHFLLHLPQSSFQVSPFWHEELQKQSQEKSNPEHGSCLAAWDVNTWLQLLIKASMMMDQKEVFTRPLGIFNFF